MAAADCCGWTLRHIRARTWALQQLREVVGKDNAHRHLLHDRDSIFAKHLDDSIKALGVDVLKSPPRSPKANAICERVIGTIRRDCPDWMIPPLGGAPACHAENLGRTLQPWKAAQQFRAWHTGAAAHGVGERKPTELLSSVGGRALPYVQNPCLGDCTMSITWCRCYVIGPG